MTKTEVHLLNNLPPFVGGNKYYTREHNIHSVSYKAVEYLAFQEGACSLEERAFDVLDPNSCTLILKVTYLSFVIWLPGARIQNWALHRKRVWGPPQKKCN